MRRAARTDGNQSDVVGHLRRLGFSVAITSGLGAGFPDLVIGRGGRNWLIELKDPAQPLCKRRLTPDEQLWHQAWRGQVATAETVDEILEAIRES